MNININKLNEVKKREVNDTIGLFVDKEERMAIVPKNSTARAILVWLSNEGEVKLLKDTKYQKNIVEEANAYRLNDMEEDGRHRISELDIDVISDIIDLTKNIDNIDFKIKTLNDMKTFYIESKDFKFLITRDMEKIIEDELITDS